MHVSDLPQEGNKTPAGTMSEASPAREGLQGWIPSLAEPDEVRDALEKAFDYRGDVTITLKTGERIEGYVFDRKMDGPSLGQCFVRMFPKEGSDKIVIAFGDIARLEFTGRDTAVGRRFDVWLRNYRERKARGEKNISLDPEPLN